MLRHCVKKGKVIVSEGTSGVVFNYIVDPVALTCQCQKRLCPHLRYYLCDVMKVRKQLLPILTVPRVKAAVTSNDLETFCCRFLTDEDEDHCVICHTSYLSASSLAKWLSLDVPVVPDELYQCTCCFELIHQKCFNRWSATGNGCPRCKHGSRHPPSKSGSGSANSEWPALN